jgi:hypothetical protein
MFTRLKEYSRVLKQWSPDHYDEEWALDTAASFNLIKKINDDYVPTLAGILLFGRSVERHAPMAKVMLEVEGPEVWIRECFGSDTEIEAASDGNARTRSSLTGTLWTLLDALLDALSRLNTQFRLKEETSRQVRPYAPLALKEMIVNALAHRDYQEKKAVCIRATPQHIEAISPGGLVQEVCAEIGGYDLETLIKSGRRNIKGYRNPVVADLLYGGGAMDHTGSGLSDLWRETVDNNGNASFGSTQDNNAFRVLIEARPEAIDQITNTAVSLTPDVTRFATNLIPIEALPEKLWHAGTSERYAWQVQKSAEKNNLQCPDGYIHGGRYYSLYDLANLSDSLVSPFDVGDIEEIALSELLALPDGRNIFVKLLSDFFIGHCCAINMYYDHRHKRVYYTRSDEDAEIKVNYKARFKHATRTIVKPRQSRDGEEILWYEHKSFGFKVMDFDMDWAIAITPGYAFTKNGYGRYISREKTNVLSTRRAAKDFNSNVYNDVTFWLAMISEGQEGLFALRSNCTSLVEPFAPYIELAARLPTTSYQTEIFVAAGSGDTVDEEMESLAQEIDALSVELDDVETDHETPTHLESKS